MSVVLVDWIDGIVWIFFKMMCCRFCVLLVCISRIMLKFFLMSVMCLIFGMVCSCLFMVC